MSHEIYVIICPICHLFTDFNTSQIISSCVLCSFFHFSFFKAIETQVDKQVLFQGVLGV